MGAVENNVSSVNPERHELTNDKDNVLTMQGVDENHNRSNDGKVPKSGGDGHSARSFGRNPLDNEPREKYELCGKTEHHPRIEDC